MFEHLLDPKFDDIDGLDTPALMSAQANTTAWLEEIGATSNRITDAQKDLARKAFTAVTDIDVKDADKKKSLMALKVPPAVKHLAGMLSEYDWDFVEQAKEMRGYVVAQTVELTKHPDPRIQLQALKLLGSVTEVGSFTERIEIRKVDATMDELQEKLRSKLATLLPKTVEVQDATPKTDA